MREYRFFTMRADGSIAASKVENLADDLAARTHASQILDGHAIEIWQGDRLALRLGAEDRAA